ncbi:MAG: hypothetical protein ACOH5I_12930 [Oligoflexus sp.]
MNFVFRPLVIIGLSALLLSCGAWLGNPKDFEDDKNKKNQVDGPTDIELSLVATGLQENRIKVRDRSGASAGDLQINQLSIFFKDIKLQDETKNQKIVWNMNQAADLMTSDRLLIGRMPAASFAVASLNIESSIEPFMAIKAEYAGKAFSMSLSMSLEEALLITGEKSFDPATGLPIVLELALSRWFNFNGHGLDLGQLTDTNTDLDQTEVVELQQLKANIKSNIMAAISYGQDSDGDGLLSESERAAPFIPPQLEDDGTSENPSENPSELEKVDDDDDDDDDD